MARYKVTRCMVMREMVARCLVAGCLVGCQAAGCMGCKRSCMELPTAHMMMATRSIVTETGSVEVAKACIPVEVPLAMAVGGEA